MVKKRDRFQNPLKEKLNDYRGHLLTLDEILDYIYSIDPKFKNKILSLQNEKLQRNKKNTKTADKK